MHMKNPIKIQKNAGFTLVEMAIAIVIIGFLVAGVLAGTNMLRNAEVVSVVADFEKYRKAYYGFEKVYNQYPGDMSDPTQITGATGTGDGDGAVEGATALGAANANEQYFVWSHLAAAGFIDGGYTGVAGTGYSFGTNAPASKVTNAGFKMFWNGTSNTLLHTAATTGSVINPIQAWSIDKKLDDGNASTGELTATGGSCHSSGAYSLATEAAANAISCYVTLTLR